MKYQWLLFDADGTLFDYDLSEAKALRNTFQDFDLPFSSQTLEAYRRINRQIWIDFENKRISAVELRTRRFGLLFAAVGVEADPNLFSAAYLGHLANGTDLVAGAHELVMTLRSRFRLGIITNGLRDVQRPRLDRSAIAGMFDVVTISEEIGAAKPDPAFFATVFDQMGWPPKNEVLVIGDSLTSDIQGGNRFGLDTCWYNPRRAAPDPRFPARYEIQTFTQLMKFLG